MLKLKNNLGWEFICSEPKIEINEGIYFGEKKLKKNNHHILISEKIIPDIGAISEGFNIIVQPVASAGITFNVI